MRTLATLFALTLSTAAFAVPMQLTHQGRVDDASGVPLEGVHSVTVSLYADAAGGSPLWTGAMDATFTAGSYALILGSDSGNPLPPSAFDGSLRYLTLAVDGAPEMAPRLPITSVPYAVRAGHAELATDVQGGVADVSELRINGTTVIGSDGVLSAPLSYNDLTDVPDDRDTLGGLACASGEIAVFNGLDWACGAQAPASIDVNTLSGTIAITNLPVGTGASEVAAGDHTHGFGQITGQAAIGQLPTGTSSTTVALGDHGHVLASLSGDLPFSRVSGTAAIGQLPTGTTGTTVALGNHSHAFSAITGTAAIGQLPVGTTSSTVARGDHAHAFSAITGTAAIGQLPTGTSGTTVALGNHGHDASAITSGTLTGEPLQQLGWMMMHAAAAGACAAASPVGDSPWGHVVLPHEGGRSCASTCANRTGGNYTQCRTSIAIGGLRTSRATAYTDVVSTNYNYGCNDTQNAYDEVQNQGLFSSYTAYCCCYR
jgi:hypothetical protein